MVASLVLVLAWIAVPPAGPASAAKPADDGRIAIDPITCSSVLASLRAPDSSLSQAQRRSLKSVTDADCYMLITIEPDASVGAARGADAMAAAAATTCLTKQGNLSIYAGPIETWTARQAAYVCWNGTKAWYTSPNYMNCWVTTIPGYAGEKTWCGVASGNNTAILNLRHDFKVWTWAAPFWFRYGWAVTQINKNGGVTTYGSCCT